MYESHRACREIRRNKERGVSMSRRPLLKGVAPPLADNERLVMLREAMRAIAQRRDMDPRLKARGIAPLASAARRLDAKLKSNGAHRVN